MKFTSKDLMKAMNLQIGDKIKTYISTFIIKESTLGIIYLEDTEDNDECYLSELVGVEYEILPRPKRVGDLKCDDFECAKCHLRCLPHCNQMSNAKKTLFNILNGWNEYDTFDQEIHDLLKARLDKEVE